MTDWTPDKDLMSQRDEMGAKIVELAGRVGAAEHRANIAEAALAKLREDYRNLNLVDGWRIQKIKNYALACQAYEKRAARREHHIRRLREILNEKAA